MKIWRFLSPWKNLINLEIFKPLEKFNEIEDFGSPLENFILRTEIRLTPCQKPLDERLNSKQTKGTKFLLKSGSSDKLSFHNLFQCNCFILIYFRKLNKIHQNVQRFSLNTFGETTSPLSRKSINCSSVIAFPFVWLFVKKFFSVC